MKTLLLLIMLAYADTPQQRLIPVAERLHRAKMLEAPVYDYVAYAQAELDFFAVEVFLERRPEDTAVLENFLQTAEKSSAEVLMRSLQRRRSGSRIH